MHGVRHHLGGDVDADVFDPGHTARRGNQGLAQQRQLALARIAELDVEGHTDDVGSDAYNQGLSVKRAESVKAYLVTKGIEKNRVYTEGKGEKQPVADNKTEAGRAIAAGFIFMIGMVPGLPGIPFTICALGVGGLAYGLKKSQDVKLGGGSPAAGGQSPSGLSLSSMETTSRIVTTPP